MLDSKKGQIKLEDILVVKEFPDVFPEELLGLPPERELDLSIEILPRMVKVFKVQNKVCSGRFWSSKF